MGFFDPDLPQGPARRPAQRIVDGLGAIPDLQFGRTELQKRNWMVEFHLPDRDPHYPSALALDRDTGRLVELTVRLGPLGHQELVDREEWQRLEADWADIVLDAASTAGVIDEISARHIDLGDKWVAEEVRPHLRMNETHDSDGYDIPPAALVELIEEIVERYENRFGTFSERRFDPEFRDNFRGA